MQHSSSVTRFSRLLHLQFPSAPSSIGFARNYSVSSCQWLVDRRRRHNGNQNYMAQMALVILERRAAPSIGLYTFIILIQHSTIPVRNGTRWSQIGLSQRIGLSNYCLFIARKLVSCIGKASFASLRSYRKYVCMEYTGD